jgi:D-alanyl-D-alanine carboxypeptidase
LNFSLLLWCTTNNELLDAKQHNRGTLLKSDGNISEEVLQVQHLKNIVTILPPHTRQLINQIISNGKTESFISDLNKVLAADRDDLLLLVDKNHELPVEYAPKDIELLVENNYYKINRNNLFLRKPAEKALKKMAAAALNNNISLFVSSAYRSYKYQIEVYNRNMRTYGKKNVDNISARPGKSQHQLGTVIDFGSITDEFAKSIAGRWLNDNAYKYGWSLSFPKGYENVTGYKWESWHYRYVGIEAVNFQKKWFSNVQ